MDTFLRGIILFYRRLGGYGFVIDRAGGEDVFFTHRELPEGVHDVKKGQNISYTTKPSVRKPGTLVVAKMILETDFTADADAGGDQ
jgi:cold shock CspA family protein